jgi:hypothetical protein
MRFRLKGSWAELFRHQVLPILLECEDGFSQLYGKRGRPNFSVARMLGLCFLQELYSFSVQQALSTTYWTSTTFASNTEMGWDVYFALGNVDKIYKSIADNVRAVRGGQ